MPCCPRIYLLHRDHLCIEAANQEQSHVCINPCATGALESDAQFRPYDTSNLLDFVGGFKEMLLCAQVQPRVNHSTLPINVLHLVLLADQQGLLLLRLWV